MAGRSLIPSLPLFADEARDAVGFYNALRLPDVPDLPKLADASGVWFREIVAAVFGSRDPATNSRFIREFLLLAPKGSSKTSYSAALMLTAVLMNHRPRAEFLLIAPTQAVADGAFAHAVGMIQADAELSRRFHIRDHMKEIVDRLNKAKLRIKTFSLDVITGTKPVGVLLDEIHLLGRVSYAAKVMVQIRGGLEKSPEGFLVMTTTQSDEQPTGIFRSELLSAREIRDGKRAGRILPVLYEFPEKIARDPAQWQNPDNWHLVSPNMGRSIHLASLIESWNVEREKGDAAIRIWASQHLNIEIGVGIKDDGWVGAEFWEKRGDKTLTLEALLDRCEIAVVGIDGGGLDDLLGLAVLGRERVTKRWLLWSHAWCKEVVLVRRKEIASKLRDLEAAGELTIVPNESGDDAEQVADIIEQVHAAGLLPEKNGVGVDTVAITEILNAIEDRDFYLDGMIAGITQGWKLTNAIKTSERALAQGSMIHGASDLMAFAVGNCKVEPRGNAIVITKQASGSAKIDPVMAMFNAVTLMAANPQAASASYLETETAIFL